MKQQNRVKKWKLLIICIWIVFLAAAGFGCFSLQRSSVFEKAKTELSNQEEIISGQFAGLVETDFLSREVFYDRLISEVKAISFVLEKYDDIGQAKDFLDNIVNTTDVKNLWIYDRSGNVLFGNGDAPENNPEPDEIAYVLNSKNYESIEGVYNADEKYLTTTYILDEDSNGLVWGVKDQYLIYAKDSLTDTLKDVVKFFDWDHILQDITIGMDGSVLAASKSEGLVLSWSDSSVRGKPVEDLNIRVPGDNTAADVNRLLEAFPQAGEVKEIEVNSVRSFATRMDIDNDLFLVMFPVNTIEKNAYLETAILLIPLALLTGIGILYAFCLIAEGSGQSNEDGKKKGILNVSVGKLKLFAIMAVLLMLVCSGYLETHLVYSQMFQYTSTTSEDVLQKKSATDNMMKELQSWQLKGSLAKCRIARSCIQYAPADKLDRQYVTDLAKCLNVSSVYLFDKKGKVSLTNAPYDGYVIDGDSPFCVLLEGKDSVVLQPDSGKAAGNVQQNAGVTLIDETNRVAGAVIIEDSTFPLISDSLSFDNVFQRVFLKDNTVVIAVNSENMTVQYFAQVEGSFLVSDEVSLDSAPINADDLGLDQKVIKDHFNGELFAVNNSYFASIRRNDNTFLMVMRPLVFLDAGNIRSMVLGTAAALLFFILLICFTRSLVKASEEDSAETDSQAEEIKAEPSMANPEDDKDVDDTIALLKKLTDRGKYDFEKRWPNDGKKWKDKTPLEKYTTSVKLIFVIVIAAIVARVAISGKDSILYYSFTGEWNSGINLYSITASIISIIVLVLLKEILHKILFLIARAANSKGETICHLFNSYLGYLLFIAGLFIVLGTLGVDVATLSLTGGVAGVIFGIGCQNIVADMLAGIIMSFEGIACAGDFVSYNGKYAFIESIGVRTIKLKWFSEITLVRNNEFKNFVNMPAMETDRVTMNLVVDLKEPISRLESIIEKELPEIRDRLAVKLGDDFKLKYRGVNGIEENGKKLGFAIFCKGMYYSWARRMLTRELLLMCERYGIQLAMPQVVVNQPVPVRKDTDVMNDSDD